MSAEPIPRILFVGAFPPPGSKIYGGMVTSCRALMQSSLPSRANLVLVDSTQIDHPPPGLFTRLVLAVRRFVTYVVKFEKKRPDAVILFTAAGASVAEKGAMAWYAHLRGVSALMFPRGGPVMDACRRSRFTRTWTRWAFRGARLVLCQGRAWQDFAVEVLGFKAADALVIPNWTATGSLLDIGGTRVSRSGAARILFVGWLDREKGVGELLEACRSLAKEYDFSLTLVGEGNMSTIARAFVTENKLDHVVNFPGWLDGDRLHEEYAAADIFVLPSWSEGLPNAMVEAMAARLAIVVSAVGNVPGVVKDGQSALLIPPRNADELRSALTRVLNDRDLRETISTNAHSIAAEQFSVEPAVQKILSAVHYAESSRAG